MDSLSGTAKAAASLRPDRRFVWLAALGGAAAIWGARLIVIAYGGGISPTGDEWDAELDWLIRPFRQGTGNIATLLHPVNDHFVFFTKIRTLILYHYVGYYDPVLNMILNALFVAVIFVSISLVISRVISEKFRIYAICTALLVLSLPFGVENIVMGFNLHFYLLIAFSCAAMACFASGEAFGWRWLLGLLMSIASYACLASGALTAVAGAALCLLQILAGHRRKSREWLGLGTQLLVALLLISNIPPNPGADYMNAHSVSQFVGALTLKILSWPRRALIGPLVYAPAAIFAFQTLRERAGLNDPRWLNIGLLVWVGGQSAALAYARAGYLLPSRYLDTLVVGVVLSIISAGWILERAHSFRASQIVRRATIGWLGLMLIGLLWEGWYQVTVRVMPQHSVAATQAETVKAYLVTGDSARLVRLRHPDIPYPDAQRLKQLLDNPTIRDSLPPQLRSPASAPGMLQRVESGILSAGWALAVAGVLVMLVGAWQWRRTAAVGTAVPV